MKKKIIGFVIGIFSLKSFVIFLALNAINKKAPIKKSTIEILTVTEKYEVKSLLFFELAKINKNYFLVKILNLFNKSGYVI